MENLQYDPKSKQRIKDALYDFLYKPLQEQFKSKLEALIIRNTLLGGFGHKSFYYKGQCYTLEADPDRKRNKLLPQLYPAMDDYLKEVEQLNKKELPFVIGFINQVLNSSNDFQDYFKLLPEAIHAPLEAVMVTCPCRHRHLSEADIQALKDKNANNIMLLKKRLMQNLLI